MNADQKFTVERYLDQVKILTALATTLLLTPNLWLTLLEKDVIRARLDITLVCWRDILFLTNLFFLFAILATYFIYSSVVGSLNKKEPVISRLATRIFSIAQFGFVVLGCIGLLLLFTYSV